MEKVRAWELLHDPEYSSGLDMDGLHRLMIRAGFSAEVAQKAATQRAWERMSQGVVI